MQDTWQWHRQEAAPDQPQPSPRDRASLVALSEDTLLLYGGADALNRRLDDTWLYSTAAATWTEVKPAGARPRGRCCASLFTTGDRAMVFGGDCGAAGASGELWSLRGARVAAAAAAAGAPPVAPAQWTLLQLEGPAPAPRRGHATAVTAGGAVVVHGGVSEQKSLLGMKKQSEHLAGGWVAQN